MQGKFVPYEFALELKELGFDEQCIAVFINKTNDFKLVSELKRLEAANYQTISNNEFAVDNEIVTPLWQDAFDWFDENHKIYSSVKPAFSSLDPSKIVYNYYFIVNGADFTCMIEHDTKLEARLDCLQKLIELVKNS